MQGADKIRRDRDKAIKSAYVNIFVMPPTMKELHRRLSGRGTDDASVIELRMDNAREEIKHWRDYPYVMTSGAPSEDRETFRAILEAERHRTPPAQPRKRLPEIGQDLLAKPHPLMLPKKREVTCAS